MGRKRRCTECGCASRIQISSSICSFLTGISPQNQTKSYVWSETALRWKQVTLYAQDKHSNSAVYTEKILIFKPCTFFRLLLTASKISLSPKASRAGAQERTAQPETAVTLQFRGKTFTLFYSQFCRLIGKQSLSNQGKMLHGSIHFFLFFVFSLFLFSFYTIQKSKF